MWRGVKEWDGGICGRGRREGERRRGGRAYEGGIEKGRRGRVMEEGFRNVWKRKGEGEIRHLKRRKG